MRRKKERNTVITTLITAAFTIMLALLAAGTESYAATDLLPGYIQADLEEGTYELDGTYFLAGDLTGDYCFEIPDEGGAMIYMQGHAIDGGCEADAEDVFTVGEDGTLIIYGGSSETERNVYWWEDSTFGGWHFDADNTEKVSGGAILNAFRGVVLEDGAELITHDLTIGGCRRNGIYGEDDDINITLDNSRVFYTSDDEGLGGIFIDGDAARISLVNGSAVEQNHNVGESMIIRVLSYYDTIMRGGNITIIGDDCSITGDDDKSCHIRSGFAPFAGGGIYIDGDDAEIKSLVIGNNKAGNGGGIYIKGEDPRIENVTCERNTASTNNASDILSSKGGGIYTYDDGAVVKSSTLSDNHAGLDGGGMFFNGNNTLVEDCTVIANSCGLDGGGIFYCGQGNRIIGTAADTCVRVEKNDAKGKGKGIYTYDGDISLQGKIIVRNNSNSMSGSIPTWSNLCLVNNAELNVTAKGASLWGRLDNNSEVWVDSKCGRWDDPSGGYIYHDSSNAPIDRYGFYSDRLGYSFVEKDGTLCYKSGSSYPEVTVAAPTLSPKPKAEGEKWEKYPGRVYIKTDPSFEFSQDEKHYTVTRILSDGKTESLTFDNGGIQTDENGDFVDLTGKQYTYTFSLYNTLTVDGHEQEGGSGKVILGTSPTVEAAYALAIPHESSRVRVKSADGTYETIGTYARGDRVSVKPKKYIWTYGQEPQSWTIEYTREKDAGSAETEVVTQEGFPVSHNRDSQKISFTVPEDLDGGVTTLTPVLGNAKYTVEYKASPAECTALLPAYQEGQEEQYTRKTYQYKDSVTIGAIDDQKVGETTYYTDKILLDGKAIDVAGGRTISAEADHEVEYVFTTEQPKRECTVTYDSEGTGLAVSELRFGGNVGEFEGTETFRSGEDFLSKHRRSACATAAGSLRIDHFQIGVPKDGGGFTFSEDKTLAVNDPVTEDMTLRLIVVPAYKVYSSSTTGVVFDPAGAEDETSREYVAGDTIKIRLDDKHKKDEYKGKVVDYWDVERYWYNDYSAAQLYEKDVVRADGTPVSQNEGATGTAAYKLSEDSIQMPLTEHMNYASDLKKLSYILFVPHYKDAVTDITGVPDKMQVGESWNTTDAVIWPETVKDSNVSWKLLSSRGIENDISGFRPSRPGRYTLEATVKDGLGLTKDYIQTFEVTVEGSNEYIVSFDTDAEGVEDPSDQYVSEGDAATEPDAPERKGWVFAGWYKDGSLYDFGTPVTGDTVLKAQWKALYKVTASAGGSGSVETIGDSTDGLYTAGSTVTVKATPDEGYKVSSWKDNGRAVSGNTSDVYTIENLGEDHTVEVSFEAKEEGGSVQTETVTAGAGTQHAVRGSIYVVTSADTVRIVKAPAGKSFTIPAAVRIGGKPFSVTGIQKGAFRGTKVRTLTVKTKGLTKSSVRGSLKGSKIRTVKVRVGKKKDNRKYVKKYKKIFTKKNCGRKVRVTG